MAAEAAAAAAAVAVIAMLVSAAGLARASHLHSYPHCGGQFPPPATPLRCAAAATASAVVTEKAALNGQQHLPLHRHLLPVTALNTSVCVPFGYGPFDWFVHKGEDTIGHSQRVGGSGAAATEGSGEEDWAASAIPQSMLYASGRAVAAALAPLSEDTQRWRSCALVGNSGVLKGSARGAEIDKFDVVVRSNQGPTKGYERYVGTKTTARLLNRLWTLAYAGRERKRERHSRGGAVVCLNPTVTRAAGDLLESYLPCLKKAGRVRPDWKPGTAPTSGLVGTLMLLYACEHLSLYGFGGGGRNFSYQLRMYYKLYGTERRVGNKVHSFSLEEMLISALAHEGHIRLCKINGCIGAPLPPHIISRMTTLD